MAKDRPEKPVKEKSSKKEKKVSEDKVKKAKKEKKPKPLVTPQESDSDSDSSGGAPVLVKEEQTPKKLAKKEKTGKKQNKEELIRAQLEGNESSEESDSSSSSDSSDSEDDSEAPAVKAPSKKTPKAAVKIEPNSMFTIDTKPTPVNRKAAAPSESSSSSDSDSDSDSSSDEEEAKGSKPTEPQANGNGAVPLNRTQRRRLQLIGRQREIIRKSLDIAPGSNEKAAELEAALAQWTQKYDDKAAIRTEKKAKRKEKDALKLRNKRGKLLKGRRLRERTKQVNKMEKKAVKKGAKRE